MEKSENINELIVGLVGFHKEVGKIIKNAKNPFFKSNYGNLNSYLAEIKEPLSNNGLAVIQLPITNGLTTMLSHTSGQYISESMTMQPSKNDPQGQGSALTYMRRYSLASILNLNAEDDDGNEATRSPQKPTSKPQAKKKVERLNYTALAEKHDTIESLGKWFKTLTKEQQVESASVVKERKAEIVRKESESNKNAESFTVLIGKAKSEGDLKVISSTIDELKDTIENYGELTNLFNAKCNELNLNNLTRLPF